MNNIKRLLDVVDRHRDHMALALLSDPGLSKTSQINQWAEEHGRNVVEIITSQRMPSEISGMPMPVEESRTMEIYDFNTLLDMKDGDVLFFDEFTNGNINTLNACLTLVQDRVMMSGKKLPSILIVAAGNPQGRCDLLPQTKQRFMWAHVRFDRQFWSEYMSEKWGFVPSADLLDKVEDQYRTGFGMQNEMNYATARSVENIVRLAMDIDQEDPFWSSMAFDCHLVSSVYRSISMEDKLAVPKKQALEFIDTQLKILTLDNDTPEKKAANTALFNEGASLASEIRTCGTMRKFADIVKNIEEGQWPLMGPAMLQWLKTEDPVEEPEDWNDSEG